MYVEVLRPAGYRGEGAAYRTSVTFRDDSMPLPVRFHFVHLYVEETGEHEWRHVGLELGEEPGDEETAIELPELTALALRQLVERYPRWLELALAHAQVDLSRAGDLARGAKRIKPARLDREWYRMVADEYRRHIAEGEPSPVSTIASSHGVSPSAASRWLKSARELGLLDGRGAA